jgi:signal transduction histidine kinase
LLNAGQAVSDGGSVRVATGAGPASRWGDGQAHVGRSFPPDDATVAIAITDDGPGISPADLGRIFEPFFSTKGRDQGSGLGLAICHSLIEVLEGSLVVESRVGGGTTVRVLLPAAGPADVAEPARRGAGAPGVTA